MSCDNITCVYEDHIGFVWIGTSCGLNRFDGHDVCVFNNDPFDNATISSDRIGCIFEDSQTNLWIGTEAGLSRYDRSTNKFFHYPFHIDHEIVYENDLREADDCGSN